MAKYRVKRLPLDVEQHASLQKRFFEKVQKTSTCWVWIPSGPSGEYGSIIAGGKTVSAGHAAWYLAHGEWPPPGIFVCHKCDRKSCVNPEHLWLGTCAQNNLDMKTKGRQASKSNGRWRAGAARYSHLRPAPPDPLQPSIQLGSEI